MAAVAVAGGVPVKIWTQTGGIELTFYSRNTIMKLSEPTASGCQFGQFLCI